MSDWIPIALSLVAAVVSLGGAFMVYKSTRQGDKETNVLATRKEEREDRESIIETYREERRLTLERLAKVESDVAELRTALKETNTLFRTALDFIEKLWLWAHDGSKPPIPDVPDSLRSHLDPALFREHVKQQDRLNP